MKSRKRTRYVRVVMIDKDSLLRAEDIVNQAVNELNRFGCSVVSIVPLSAPFLMYNIIYESEKEIGELIREREKEPEQPEPEAEPEPEKGGECDDRAGTDLSDGNGDRDR